MSVMSRIANAFGLARDAGLIESPTAGTARAPRRDFGAVVTPARAMTLSTVFRAVQIHATSVSQLSLDVERGGLKIDTSAIVATPSLKMTRSAFLEETTTCLYLDGNAFYRLVRAPGADATSEGPVVDVEILDPRQVAVKTDVNTGRVTYGYGQKEYTSREIRHLKFLRITGLDRGLGPIQAAQTEIAGALDARDYGSKWFTEAGMPNGILTTDSALSPDQAKQYKNAWKGLDEKGEPVDGFSAHDVRVLGQGLSYAPLLLKPADVQFLESQQFTTTQIARLLGIPASLLLAAVEGNAQTYSNVEQDWIAYVRFSLMNVLREIEEVFTEILPRGQRARFNIDALLRTDTKTRYEAHNLALTGKWKTVDEIRSTEGMPALTDDQRAQIAATAPPAIAPAPKETPVA